MRRRQKLRHINNVRIRTFVLHPLVLLSLIESLGVELYYRESIEEDCIRSAAYHNDETHSPAHEGTAPQPDAGSSPRLHEDMSSRPSQTSSDQLVTPKGNFNRQKTGFQSIVEDEGETAALHLTALIQREIENSSRPSRWDRIIRALSWNRDANRARERVADNEKRGSDLSSNQGLVSSKNANWNKLVRERLSEIPTETQEPATAKKVEVIFNTLTSLLDTYGSTGSTTDLEPGKSSTTGSVGVKDILDHLQKNGVFEKANLDDRETWPVVKAQLKLVAQVLEKINIWYSPPFNLGVGK